VELTASGLAPGGKAGNFNGNQYVKVTQDLPEENFTIEMWVKTTEQYTGIFSVHDENTGGYDRTMQTYSGYLNVRVYPSYSWTSDFYISDGEWHHIALVVESGVGQTIYVDGVSSGVGDGLDQSAFDWQTSFRIGYSQDSYPNYFKGQIDNVRIWNEPRTEGEIRSIMMLESPVSAASLIYHSAFNGNVQAAIGNNGTSFGNVSFPDPGYYTYTWTGIGAPAPSTSETQTTAVLTQSGSYNVTASAQGGCSASAPTTLVGDRYNRAGLLRRCR
jgi:hypothetical protein